MTKNPLLDVDFLIKLTTCRQREVFARITALTLNELPLEYIEGKVTGGSISVDGSSAVRRTCSLSMVAKNVNINDFYWGLKNKFKLEIGLKNIIDSSYPEIIWFKQGLFIITSFSTSQSTNNFTINISGKDKMCLLNGDLAGILPHSVDFGIEEYFDKNTGITTYTNIPIKNIIREAVQNFGNELAHNIIINDIEDAGLELLEYRGNTPIYLFRAIDSDQFINMTIQGSQTCYVDGIQTIISDSNKIKYDNLIDLEIGEEPTIIKLDPNGTSYTIAKFEYGSIPGYRLTDLTYAGDLIANIGEALTSVLDKIKNMLGEFEYFYDIDGRFIFQRKKNSVNTIWNSLEQNNDGIYINSVTKNSAFTFSFVDGTLITSLSNNPNLLNLRNDYAVWGKKKTLGGVELPIHARYAIDFKPTVYNSIAWYDNDGNIKKNAETFTTKDWDWRELIYRMALDYRQNYHRDNFLYELAQANPQYPHGKTGYEQYYTDLEGFWRQLYNPDPELKFEAIINEENIITTDDLYMQYAYRKATEEDLKNIDYDNLYVLYKDSIYPFIEGYCHLIPGETYFYLMSDGTMNAGTNDLTLLNQINIRDIYSKSQIAFATSDNEIIQTKDNETFSVYLFDANESIYGNYKLFIDECFTLVDKNLLYVKEKKYLPFNQLDAEIQKIYCLDSKFKKYISRYKNFDNFGNIIDTELILEKNYYYQGYYDYFHDPLTNNYWLKDVFENPENLLFWFDFLDAEGSDLAKYAIPTVGTRAKAINDNDVKSIYYREIPTTIFQSGAESYEHQTGYTYIQLQETIENLFTISSKGKSAKERIDELLYDHTYCIENINITTIPVYHLEPNTRILVQDDTNNINGEYIVSRLTIPLTYNGTMSITATKAVENFI